MSALPGPRPRPSADQPPGQTYEVLRLQQETADAVSIFLRPESVDNEFLHCPGQYLSLSLNIGRQTYVRCYSLSSSPGDGLLRITVKRIKQGLVSSYLTSTVQVGDRLQGSRACGRFTLQDPVRPFVGIAAGSGITPVLPMLKHQLRYSSQHCRLLYVTPCPEQTIFQAELASLARAFPGRFSLQHWYTRSMGRLVDWPLHQQLAALISADQPDVYLCGPAAWMSHVRSALEEMPSWLGNCYQECFSDAQTREISLSTTRAGLEHRVLLRHAGVSHELRVPAGQTVLAAAQAVGLELPSGCEQGKCGSCLALCRSGPVEAGSSDFLTDEERSQGYILCCQARPAGSCEIELLEG